MPQLCLYLHLHQPYRLAPFEVFDLEKKQSYFARRELNENREIFLKVTQKSYRPMLTSLESLLAQLPSFTFALSITGLFIEQARAFAPEIMAQLRRLVKTGRVEILAETYYHSLASLYSETEFRRQVALHLALIKREFGFTPTTFRNTELIYSNHIAWLVYQLGFRGILTEAVDRYLGSRARTELYASQGAHPLPLLLKHAPLSDDIAFRFSDRNWPLYPLQSQTYLAWLNDYRQEELINLFMDFETFGEHQWADTGIFAFFERLVHDFSVGPYNRFVTPATVLAPFYASKTRPASKKIQALPVYDVPEPISWADLDRDLTAWIDNPYQRDSLRLIYQLEDLLRRRANERLLDRWGRLQTSDHFYYMCTKWAADGDVHAYFSPYQSPHEAYRRYSIVLADFMQAVGYWSTNPSQS